MTAEQGFGNDIACDNCGNEWGPMVPNGSLFLCEECNEAWQSAE